MGFLTYIGKVVLVLFGFLLASSAVYFAILNITNLWIVGLCFIALIFGVAMVWYGRELEDC